MQAHISVQPRENIPYSCIRLQIGTLDSTTLVPSAYVSARLRQSAHGRLTPTIILNNAAPVSSQATGKAASERSAHPQPAAINQIN